VAETTYRQQSDFGLFLSPYFLWFWKSDLYFSTDFCLTRAPQPRSPSSSTPTAASSGRVNRRWSVRGTHAPGSSLLFGACEGHAPPFSGRARWQLVIRRRIFVWVVLWRGVTYTPRHLVSLASFPHCQQLVFWCFCLFVFVLFSYFSGHRLLVFDSNFMGIFVG
jgi:hypothetical protein